ncbi:hypothetical protein [Chroococcidiopsis sp.]|uniref:hypothetical protein n=1 Tax=Chroococcidiopsis sp. TaxID=3088168 RepID=UPI003F40774E
MSGWLLQVYLTFTKIVTAGDRYFERMKVVNCWHKAKIINSANVIRKRCKASLDSLQRSIRFLTSVRAGLAQDSRLRQ